jgi:poly(3-hydroxybutyrate) depolymerase
MYSFPRRARTARRAGVHVALHGCNQDFGNVKRAFIDRAGYNAWADVNRLICALSANHCVELVPLEFLRVLGLVGLSQLQRQLCHQGGLQIKAIKAMLDALTSRAVPAAAAMPAAAPIALSVIDTSDTSADLVWTPQSGATGYRVSRAGAGGQFATVADVSGPGFTDSGLTPKSAYRWRVTALVNGVEDSPSNEAPQ